MHLQNHMTIISWSTFSWSNYRCCCKGNIQTTETTTDKLTLFVRFERQGTDSDHHIFKEEKHLLNVDSQTQVLYQKILQVIMTLQ